jgi:hypothetical protein
MTMPKLGSATSGWRGGMAFSCWEVAALVADVAVDHAEWRDDRGLAAML